MDARLVNQNLHYQEVVVVRLILEFEWLLEVSLKETYLVCTQDNYETLTDARVVSFIHIEAIEMLVIWLELVIKMERHHIRELNGLMLQTP